MRRKTRKTILVIVVFVAFISSSFQFKNLKLEKGNVLLLDTVHTDFLNPFIIETLPFMRVIKNSDSLLVLIFDYQKTSVDSLFSHSQFKGRFFNAIYLDIVASNESYLDARYSKLNRDYTLKVKTSRALGTAMYSLYLDDFRLKYNLGKILVSSVKKDGVIRKICEFEIIRSSSRR